MFLQSQKKKSNIIYKTSEKTKKKKSKSKSKIKPKLKPHPQPDQKEPTINQPIPEKPPMPSNLEPIINQPVMHTPEMPIEVFNESNRQQQQPYDSSNDVQSNFRFNNRQTARFGIDEEESEGPDLFVQIDHQQTNEVTTYNENKTSDFVSMGHRNKYTPESSGNRNNTGGSPFDSDGIFGNFNLSKKKTQKEQREHNSHFRNRVGANNISRKVASEVKYKSSVKSKKKMLVNIFENENEDLYSRSNRKHFLTFNFFFYAFININKYLKIISKLVIKST